MRRSATLGIGLVGLLLARGARGEDSVEALRFDLREDSHVIDVRVDRGFATLIVQRAVTNPGPKSDQATFFIRVPETAVATRLRSAGTNPRGERVWFEGDLMEAEEAAQKYKELTGIGGYYPKDPALLSWRHQGELALQVFPVPARAQKLVEYTLKIPLAYADGVYKLSLPELGTKHVPARLRFSPARSEDHITVNGVETRPDNVVVAARPIELELAPVNAPRLDVGVASVPFGQARVLVHTRIRAAPRLAEVPDGAHVAIVLDGSRSHHDAVAALAAVRAYLMSFRTASVDLVMFDREPRLPVGRTVDVKDAIARLEAFTPELRNGSNLDLALTRADAILAASPRVARRVVVVTDTRTREALGPEVVARLPWRSGAIVHMATVSSSPDASLTRVDDSPWAALPRRTGGLFWTGTIHAANRAGRTTYEEWARPKRIDRLSITGLTPDFEAPAALEEGQGLEQHAIASRETTRVEVKGELWSAPYVAGFSPSAELGKLEAALVFGSPLLHELTEPEQMRLAMIGRAVSPVTSYLAIEPGVRPSNEGLDHASGEGGGGQGFGVGLGRLGSIGHGGGAWRSFDLMAHLRRELRAAGAACGVKSDELSTTLETTLEEIVDVRDVALASARDAKAEACVRDRLWAVELPGVFAAEHDTFLVTTRL